jgi:hypothetical protein
MLSEKLSFGHILRNPNVDFHGVFNNERKRAIELSGTHNTWARSLLPSANAPVLVLHSGQTVFRLHLFSFVHTEFNPRLFKIHTQWLITTFSKDLLTVQMKRARPSPLRPIEFATNNLIQK